MTVAHAAASAVRDARWQIIHLAAVVEHPAFVVMEQAAVVVGHVEHRGEADLSLIGQTGNPARTFLCITEGWQKQAGEQADDRDDNQEFD